MAITSFVPAVTRSRNLLVAKTTKAALNLVPEASADAQESRKYFAKFVSVLGLMTLLFLLFINTLLVQDAFTLKHLKQEAKMVSDEREAIARKMDALSSPEELAKAATALGMKPAVSSTYLTLDEHTLPKSAVDHG